MCWLLSGWNETKSTLWVFGLLKQAATLDIASIDTGQCLKPPFEAFTSLWIHPCYNQPRVGRLKFRLETNSTVVWLYSGGVSLILPDVWFGTDWVTNELIHRHAHERAHTRTHTHTYTHTHQLIKQHADLTLKLLHTSSTELYMQGHFIHNSSYASQPLVSVALP